MKKVAVILSGCGVFDGAEIHESVLTLLALEVEGATYQCFAPDVDQYHVVNHLTGEVDEADKRNVLVESARIARGNIKNVTECKVEEIDALIQPGGFGVAKNLCSFDIDGPDCSVNEDVFAVCKAFAEADKVAGYACIAPALAAKVYGDGVLLTIGDDQATAQGIEAMGACHKNCEVVDIIIDEQRKIITTPAYMLAETMSQTNAGLHKMVQAVLAMCQQVSP